MNLKLQVLVLIIGLFGFCSAQTLRTAGSKILGYYDTPIGTGNTTFLRKTYYLAYVLKTTWQDAWSFCKSSTMELVTFDTQAEVDAFLKMVESQTSLFTLCSGLHVGAVASAEPPTATSWTWLSTGVAVPVTLTFGTGPSAGQQCLDIAISGTAKFKSVDCSSFSCTFVCTDTKTVTLTVKPTSTSPNYHTQFKNNTPTPTPNAG